MKTTTHSTVPALLIAIPLLGLAVFGAAQGNYFASVASAGYGGQTQYKQTFATTLLGTNEVPPVSTSTTGNATFNISMDEREIDYRLSVFNGVGVTDAHLHCARAGSNGPVVVPLYANASGTTVNGPLASGTILGSDVLPAASTCNPNITSLPQLIQAMREGNIYVNVHTLAHASGEVRGQLGTVATETPIGTNPTTPTVSASNTTARAGTNVDFTARNFAPNETVTITKSVNGGLSEFVSTRVADGGGNFGTGGISIGSTTGSAVYTFTGSTSGSTSSVTITITP